MAVFDTENLSDPRHMVERVIELEELLDRLPRRSQDVDEATRVDRLALFERAKNALAAAQAEEAARLDAAVRAKHEAAGLPKAKQGKGVGLEVALARRESPFWGRAHVGLAKSLTTELPHTLDRMRDGVLTEKRALVMAKETGYLTRADREWIDEAICADASTFDGWSDKRFENEIKRLAYALEPQAVVQRHEKAVAERRVTVRPAPDAMAYVTALVPLPQAAAVKAALERAAVTAKAAGDQRSRGQIEADRFVELMTGLAKADEVPVSVNLVMNDLALLGGDCEPAHVPGYGPIPTVIARRWIKKAGRWLRRLYARPKTGELVAMDSRKRLFSGRLRELLDIRDDTCRTPYCGAPIRHRDHLVGRQRGGETRDVNGAGVCEACNYDIEAPGFSTVPTKGERHTYVLTTPTGHQHTSVAPKLPGAA